jgi:hypothetical protein
MSGARTKHALLQSGAYSPAAGGESALPCDKSEVSDIVASDDKERAALFKKLSFSNPRTQGHAQGQRAACASIRGSMCAASRTCTI